MAAPIRKVERELDIKLKSEQVEILQSLVEKRDCMAVLPTGFGKSLPFQLLPLVQKEMGRTGMVLVCCPLVSLMRDQVDRTNTIKGLTAAYKDLIGQTPDLDKEILDGKIDVVYGSPESLLGEWREQLQHLDVSAIVIDEFHLISTWGDDDAQNGKKAFRRWLGELGELRSLFPSAPLLALSATCTQNIQRRVIKALALNHHTYVYKSPDKRNIKYSVKKVPGDIDMAWTWLVDGLMELGALFPKTLIYCKSISDVAKIYDYINDEVSKEFESFIGMFHSETESSIKERILLSIRDEQSLLRIIISTNAMGMGVDFKERMIWMISNPALETVPAVIFAKRAVRVEVVLFCHLKNCVWEIQIQDTILKTQTVLKISLILI
ncbi:ATP-dependent DNA helicase RecQ-like [Saccostrea cucullata]|uniref:ATP-dependent DNA helicase RecQ-like n=1 Tax=Saccostrea cuccullata TaxID=36930 RepID=UPI002ED6A3A2